MNWFGKDNTQELESLRGENNKLNFRTKELELTVLNLKNQLQEQQPLIESLNRKINEQQNFITKYNLDVTSDPEKMARHEAIDKNYNKKSKSKGDRVYE